MVGQAQRQETEAVGHIASTLKKQGVMNVLSFSLSLGPHPWGRITYLQCGSSSLSKSIQNLPHRCVRGLSPRWWQTLSTRQSILTIPMLSLFLLWYESHFLVLRVALSPLSLSQLSLLWTPRNSLGCFNNVLLLNEFCVLAYKLYMYTCTCMSV